MCVCEQHHELVATEPIWAVSGTKVLSQGAGEDLQVLVAAMVSVCVVDCFQAVQVERDQRQRVVVPVCTAEFARQVDLEGATVAESSQGIGQRLHCQFAFVLLLLADILGHDQAVALPVDAHRYGL